MSSHLPKYVDPLALAEKGCLLEAEYALIDLTRLKDMLAQVDGSVKFNLNFAREGRSRVITGSVSADLRLACQVCMETIDLSVNRKVSLSVVTTIEQAERLAEEYEALLIEGVDATVFLMDIVEDELILALPDVAKHDDCNSHTNKNKEIGEEKRDNPFSVLVNLKKTD